MNLSMPGLPVHHQLPDFTQTHVHRVSDAIQPSHPLSSPPPPAPNPSQHQSLFQWVNSWGGQSTGVSVLASFLPKKSQGWSPSEWTGWISLQSKGQRRFKKDFITKDNMWFQFDPGLNLEIRRKDCFKQNNFGTMNRFYKWNVNCKTVYTGLIFWIW